MAFSMEAYRRFQLLDAPQNNVPSEIVLEFLILREGWEMDNQGWITEDGQVYQTSHGGRPYLMSEAEVREHIAQAERMLEGLRQALATFDPTP